MKTILLSFIILICSTSAVARENPFKPTETFLTKKQNFLDKQEKDRLLKEKLLKKKQLEELAKIEKENIIPETIEPEVIEPEVIETEVIKPKIIKIEIKPVKYTPLSFISLATIKSNLTIKVDKKYKLLKKEILVDQNKIFFDFKADKSFYTVRNQIKTKYYDSYTIGTHTKDKYFRIVVKLSQNIENYKTKVDIKNNIILLQYSK